MKTVGTYVKVLVVAVLLAFVACGCLMPVTARPALASEIAESGSTDLASATVTVSDQTYNGFALTPEPTVTLNGQRLTSGTDFTATYTNNVEPGTATVTVTGTGAYKGSATANFTIKAHPQGWDTVGGTYYYYTSVGTLCKNGFAPANGKYYYMGADGKNVKDQWIKYECKSYYIGSGGYALTNSWVKTDGSYYYVNGSGNPVVSNWAKIGGKYYYFDASGKPIVGNWAKIAGKYYYFNASGNPITNGWLNYGGKYYYFNSSGNPVSNNWAYYNGHYYYLNGSGNPVVNSWLKLGGYYYHFNASGVMQTGLVTISGEAYIFNNDGSLRIISNDSRVDRIVCRIIRDYTGFNVRKAYDFVANSFVYVKSSMASNFNNWAEYYALNLWNTGKGNCFGYSALYHFLLKAMGYSSKVIAGTCMSRNSGMYYDHCWVEVYMNGMTYICDPVLESPYSTEYIYSYFITYADNKAAKTWIVYVR